MNGFVVAAFALLATSLFFREVANAACSQRAKVPVTISNWRQFLKDGLSAASSAPTSGPGADPSIVSLWHVFLVSDGQPFDEGFNESSKTDVAACTYSARTSRKYPNKHHGQRALMRITPKNKTNQHPQRCALFGGVVRNDGVPVSDILQLWLDAG